MCLSVSEQQQCLNPVSLFLSLLPFAHVLHFLIIYTFFIVQFFYPSIPSSLFPWETVGALRAGGHRTQLTISLSNQDGGLVEEPTTSPFLPSPSLKLPLSTSALPSQALGGIASGLGMQNLNSSRQVRLLGKNGQCLHSFS